MKKPREFEEIMSLALDDLLEEEEAKQFQCDIEQYPLLAQKWQKWQHFHQRLLDEPRAIPAPGFVERVELRLTQRQRRRRLWLGMFIGSISVLLWGSILTGIVLLGSYLFFSQTALLNEFVHNVAYYSNLAINWYETTFAALGTVLSTPQAIGIGIGYLLLSGLMLFLWMHFLRRSTHTIGGTVQAG